MQYETSTETVQTIIDCFQEGVFTDSEIQGLLLNLDTEHAVVFKSLAAISASIREINITAIESYRLLRDGRTAIQILLALVIILIVTDWVQWFGLI